ncbi:hypothetical protein MMC07_006009 [Pseudocyphellaria aurata]|nr:hypothetical protein [Pseudocyphellaria aurata]
MSQITRAIQATGTTLRANYRGTQAVPGAALAGSAHVKARETEVDSAMSKGDAEVDETIVHPASPGHVSLRDDEMSIDAGNGGVDAAPRSLAIRRHRSRNDLVEQESFVMHEEDAKEAALVACLRRLQEEQRKMHLQSGPTGLKRASLNDFREDSGEPAAKRQRVGNDTLALERARDSETPETYSGQSQEHLDRFLRQVDITFRKKPAIYPSDGHKCVYAGGCLAGRPRMEWDAMAAQICADLSRPWSWKAFVTMLQDGLQPKAKREVSLYMRIAATHQLENQSLGGFFAYLALLERQLEHEVPDWLARMWIFSKVHPHLVEALKRRDRLGNTRWELEEALKSIEGDEPAPTGMTVTETETVDRGDSAVKKTSITKSKSNPRRFRGKGVARSKGKSSRHLPAQDATSSRNNDSCAIQCYNCNKMGHISRDCKAPRTTIARTGSDQSIDSSFHVPIQLTAFKQTLQPRFSQTASSL